MCENGKYMLLNENLSVRHGDTIIAQDSLKTFKIVQAHVIALGDK